jgi:hypothetical protein
LKVGVEPRCTETVEQQERQQRTSRNDWACKTRIWRPPSPSCPCPPPDRHPVTCLNRAKL